MIHSRINEFDLSGKRVLVRADLNVPLKNGTILDDFRLKAILPTIQQLQNKDAQVILASHIGRPEGPNPSLSTIHLVDWFQKHGITTVHASSFTQLKNIPTNPHTMILLENLRFDPRERTNDIAFAQELHNLADYYVNDAFGTLHRKHASVNAVAYAFPQDKRSIGPLVEKEVSILDQLLKNPEHPVVLILGGGKIASKVPMLENLSSKIDTLLLCPAAVFTFLKAEGKPTGRSLIDEEHVTFCKRFLDKTALEKIDVKFPVDYVVADKEFSGPLSLCPADSLPKDAVGISVGPKTINQFGKIIKKAGTILYAGLMGSLEHPKTLSGFSALLDAMKESKALSIIAGGDSVGAARFLHKEKNATFLSTGGGATLHYLSGEKLPGLEPFE